MKKIIWISSYPKSGNTWTRYFLSNYFFNKQKINSDFNILNNIDKFPPYKFLPQLISEDEIKESAYNISKYWTKIQLEITKEKEDFIFLKNHNALVSVEGRSLTDERFSLAFIYLVRDPRDVIASWMQRKDFSGSSYDAILQWKKQQRLLINAKSNEILIESKTSPFSPSFPTTLLPIETIILPAFPVVIK